VIRRGRSDRHALRAPSGSTYADYTAFVGRYPVVHRGHHPRRRPAAVRQHPRPNRAATGLQTTRFREDAEPSSARPSTPTPTMHVVLFCGSGSTGALHTLIDCLELRIPAGLDDRFDLRARIPEAERAGRVLRPVRAPFERTALAGNRSPTSSRFPKTTTGGSISPRWRRRWNGTADRPMKIGSFSAASNVTGILSDVPGGSRGRSTATGAVSCWDYAGRGPVRADRDDALQRRRSQPRWMRSSCRRTYVVGGPGTPGILVARRDLFRNRVPSVPAADGRLTSITSEHRYLEDIEHREEGGPPRSWSRSERDWSSSLKEAVGVRDDPRARGLLHAPAPWPSSGRRTPRSRFLGSHDLAVGFRVVLG
jgi:hypothetical protein